MGVDGSPSAALALRWALRESQIRSASITALLTWDYLGQHHPDGSTQFEPEFDASRAAAALSAFVDEAVGADSSMLVDERVVVGLPAVALLEAAETATLLVLGARGLGGFRGLLLGSVSQRCLHLATCNVAIIRAGSNEKPSPIGRVVVGIDGSAHGQAAMNWAVGEAKLRNATLRVVHSGAADIPAIAFVPPSVSTTDVDQTLLQQAVSIAPGADTIEIEMVAASGSPAKALLEASEDADLVVVGRAGRSLLTGLAMGSVATQISHHSRIPAIFVSSADAAQPK